MTGLKVRGVWVWGLGQPDPTEVHLGLQDDLSKKGKESCGRVYGRDGNFVMMSPCSTSAIGRSVTEMRTALCCDPVGRRLRSRLGLDVGCNRGGV